MCISRSIKSLISKKEEYFEKQYIYRRAGDDNFLIDMPPFKYR